MGLKYTDKGEDDERSEANIQHVAGVLDLDPDVVGDYLVIGYDGTNTLKSATSLDMDLLIKFATMFLENVSGRMVLLV